jgi:hypothetical protein
LGNPQQHPAFRSATDKLDQGTAIVKFLVAAAKARHSRRARAWFAIVSLAGGLLFLTLHLADRVWKQDPHRQKAPAVAGASQPAQ